MLMLGLVTKITFKIAYLKKKYFGIPLQTQEFQNVHRIHKIKLIGS